MSTDDDGAISRKPGCSSGNEAPSNSFKRCKIAAISVETAVPLLEGGASKNGVDQVERVDMMTIHERLLTNMDEFIPQLAWRQVVGKLGKKADIESCFSASPFFGNLLQQKRETEVVLPTVFGILARCYCDMENKDESFKETNVKSIPWRRSESSKDPHRMTGMWKCRLVCKQWNTAIEKIHRNEDAGHYQMRLDFKKAKNEEVGREWGTNRFSTESHVDQFLGNFVATHFSGERASKKCPFLGRSVEITFGKRVAEKTFRRPVIENKQAFLNKLNDMLEKFGDQLWYFKFYWNYTQSAEHENAVFIYLQLKEMVEMMPNLKVLRIEYTGSPSTQGLADLEEQIQVSPFPEMANLKMMSAQQIPGSLCNHLVTQNRQLSRLEIDDIDFNGNCLIFKDNLLNLYQLSLLYIDSMDILEALESHPAMLNLVKFHFHCAYSCPFVPLSRVINGIRSKLNPVPCTDLVLIMPATTSDSEILSLLQDSLLCRLNLANIQQCHVGSESLSLDFLLKSKNSLREIKLHLLRCLENAQYEEIMDQQQIKFLGCEDKMERSNIAQELPRLRKMEVINDETNITRQYTIKPNGDIEAKKQER